jgi:N-acetylglucosaminyl-diphospho-decaprenol L-rhamnosyltransferase
MSAITLSVVSHEQDWLVNSLLADLAQLREHELAIVVTQNVPDRDALNAPPSAEVIVNVRPKGFGANHNAAFQRCRTPYFCVVNPDVRLNMDPFPALLAALQSHGDAGVAGPQVCDPDGRTEDSARRFPTASSLLRKLLSGTLGPDYPVDRGAQRVDWVAGMFMLFRSKAFRAVGGFDERFFLYYEDVDICRRMGALGYDAVYVPDVTVVHDARRESRRNPRRMAIHAASLLRYLARRYR